MLILTRRIGESLKIGDKVSVTVLEVKGNQARLGIAAPKDVPVHREEIFNRIAEENLTSAAALPATPLTRIVSKKTGRRPTGTWRSNQPFLNGLQVLWIGGQPLRAGEYLGSDLIELFLQDKWRC